MSPRLIAILAAVTALATVAAVAAVVRQPGTTEIRALHEPAFPLLRERPDAARRIVIRTPSGEVALARTDSGAWGTPDRYGYPMASERVRELVVQLADMRLIEPKTSLPERFARLEVGDVDGEGARSRLVRVEGADGAVLAEAIFGKRRERLTGTEPSGVYLRRPKERQSWLASGGVEVPGEVQEWLEPTIVDLPSDEVQRVAIEPAEGEAYAIVREKGAPLTIEGLAAGKELKDDANLERAVAGLSNLRLEDVKPADEVAWPDQVHRIAAATFDGLSLRARLARIDDAPWLVIDAVSAESESDAGDGASAAASERARKIRERTAGWAYRIPDSVFKELTKPRGAWLEGSDGTS